MRSVFLSDIHGNLHALSAVIDALPQHDQVFVAGDLCLEGPHPAQVWDRLEELGWPMVMGNTDRDIVSPLMDPKAGKRAAVVDWTRAQLGEERLRKLASLPFSLRGGPNDEVLVVHANPKNMDEHLYPTMSEKELEPYLAGVNAQVVTFGHLHIPYVRPVLGRLLVDVSSVGHPKDRDPRAAFTVIEWQGESRSVTQVRVPYDVEAAVHALQRSGMPRAEKEIQSLLKASY